MPRLELDIAVDQRPASGGGTVDAAGNGPQVSGTLVGPDGRESAFVGWVGLLALLQQAIAEPVPDPAPTSGTS
ncbi:MAG: hypothetical protein ACRD08_10175 [Acidimicrobiales bacterium]|jgi:hypothetical protein